MNQSESIETYFGYLAEPNDVLILLECARRGSLRLITTRLNHQERASIRSGSVFIWEEKPQGMQRWTDGRYWSASRFDGHFLTYNECPPRQDNMNTIDNSCLLIKRSVSVVTSAGTKYHLVNYLLQSDIASQALIRPSQDSRINWIDIPKNYYFKSTTLQSKRSSSAPYSKSYPPIGKSSPSLKHVSTSYNPLGPKAGQVILTPFQTKEKQPSPMVIKMWTPKTCTNTEPYSVPSTSTTPYQHDSMMQPLPITNSIFPPLHSNLPDSTLPQIGSKYPKANQERKNTNYTPEDRKQLDSFFPGLI
jgi:hypothetical protein